MCGTCSNRTETYSILQKRTKLEINITKETTRQCKFYLQFDFYNNVQMNYFCILMFKCPNVLFEYFNVQQN